MGLNIGGIIKLQEAMESFAFSDKINGNDKHNIFTDSFSSPQVIQRPGLDLKSEGSTKCDVDPVPFPVSSILTFYFEN